MDEVLRQESVCWKKNNERSGFKSTPFTGIEGTLFWEPVKKKRAVGCSKLDIQSNIELVEAMWEQFRDLGIYESHVINITEHSIKDTVSAISWFLYSSFYWIVNASKDYMMKYMNYAKKEISCATKRQEKK